MSEDQIKKIIIEQFQEKKDSHLLGIVFFGSRVKFPEDMVFSNSDFDIGIIYDGKQPNLQIPENWDLFLWSKNKWQKGFALQVEIARYAKILYDPENIIQNQFQMIQEKILPHWLSYIKKF